MLNINKLNEDDFTLILKLYKNHSGKAIADALNANSNGERRIKDYQVYSYLRGVKLKLQNEIETLEQAGLIDEADKVREKLELIVPDKRGLHHLATDRAILSIIDTGA